MFENADEQFEDLKQYREKYKEEIVSEGDSSNKIIEVNLDSLQAYLDYHFGDRPKSEGFTIQLVDELINAGITIEDINIAYEKVKDYLPQIEKEYFSDKNNNFTSKIGRWAQVGIVRQILALANDKYWEVRGKIKPPEHVTEFDIKWRAKINSK
jgi:hypothetical protein